MMKNKKPEIRFKGFSEEWVETVLNKLSILITKGTTPLDKKSSGTINYVKIENINSTSGEVTITSKITEKEHENYLKRSQLKEDDILFSIAGTLGRVTVVNKNILPANTNQALAIIRLTNSNVSFVTTYLKGKAVSEYIKRNPTVGAQPNLSLQQVGSLEIPLPSKNEQTQIGNFFKNLDNLITLHQRKYEKLGILKKAMLEKMFPKNGADVPEIRFKGFSGAWEERKLGEICVIGDIDHRMPESVTDGIPYIMTGSFTGINDIDFEDSKLISIEDYEQLAKKIKPEMGDILFARYASVGAVRYVETQMKFLVSYSCAILKNNSTFNSKYLFYYLQSKETQRQIELEINTGSQRNIGIDSLKKLNIFIPQDTEQEKIGNYFKNLDNLLTLHHGELEKLKNLKKALLEKMFV